MNLTNKNGDYGIRVLLLLHAEILLQHDSMIQLLEQPQRRTYVPTRSHV